MSQVRIKLYFVKITSKEKFKFLYLIGELLNVPGSFTHTVDLSINVGLGSVHYILSCTPIDNRGIVMNVSH